MAKKKLDRDAELSTRPSIKKKLLDIFREVEQGFTDQRERADDILDYWDAYNCKLNERQFYQGTSRIFVPIVQDAIDARKTRFTNQIFPQSGRNVEVTTSDEDLPFATIALAEHYVRRAKLRTQVIPALVVNGDVEGQYSVYVAWKSTVKNVVRKIQRPLETMGLEFPEAHQNEDIEEEQIEDEGVAVEVISDADVCVLPATVDSIDEALEYGGSVTIQRRWTKAQVKKFRDDGIFTDEAAEKLLAAFTRRDSPNRVDTAKELSDAAGIRAGAQGKYCQGFEVWSKLKVQGEKRLCVAYYGGEDIILGCKQNPYWCDECPLVSIPTKKVAGVFKGRPLVASVIDIQVDANDAANEWGDTAHFAAMPIVMTNPEKNPRVGSMVLGLAAVWETSPQDTQFAKFPDMAESCMNRIASAKAQIFQTLGVSPAMLPQSTGTRGGGKRNQAEIALEQQVDILTTADAVTNIEEGILTPVVRRMIAYDHQFRDQALLIKQYGEMGLRATMEEIEPIQVDRRYEYRWFGVEAARNAQQVQQQIALLNVFKSIPPQMYEGYRLKASPLMTQLAENAFGPRLAPLIFENMRQQLGVDPETENQMLQMGFDVMVHPYDDDQAHMMAHVQSLKMQGGDLMGAFRVHIIRHQQQMQQKAQAAAQSQVPKGLPGAPGGPGAAGTPPGAQPAPPRMLKGPPGMIAPDQMARAGALVGPRKT